MKSILDRSFQYIPSGQTDLKKTFARIKREQKAKELRKPSETVIDIGKETQRRKQA